MPRRSPTTSTAAGRPLRALDLFCGAGGVCKGLQRAGFHVTGIDNRPQPNYPGAFILADALNPPVDFDDFDFFWASPKCQKHSRLRSMWNAREHEDQIDRVRALLSGLPHCIENVPDAPLRNPITLCGSMFGLGVWRHRNFEASFPILAPQCRHDLCPAPIDVTGTGGPQTGRRKKQTGGQSRKPRNLEHAREVMGIDWMSRREISQAIPPAYSEFIARAFLSLSQKEGASRSPPHNHPKVEGSRR